MQVNALKSNPVFNVQSSVRNSTEGSYTVIKQHDTLYMSCQGQELHLPTMFSVCMQMMCSMYHGKCHDGFEVTPIFMSRVN